jgi:hypothetical protein
MAVKLVAMHPRPNLLTKTCHVSDAARDKSSDARKNYALRNSHRVSRNSERGAIGIILLRCSPASEEASPAGRQVVLSQVLLAMVQATMPILT